MLHNMHILTLFQFWHFAPLGYIYKDYLCQILISEMNCEVQCIESRHWWTSFAAIL